MNKKLTTEIKIKKFLINWFENKSKIKINKNDLEKDYFNEEWIDSFEIINLIEDLQDKFYIEFNDKDFQHRNFSTIDGLSEIIVKKMEANVSK